MLYRISSRARAFLAFVLALAVSILVANPAGAQSPVMRNGLSWTPPSEYMNGDPLDPSTELEGYRVTCGEDPAGPFPRELVIVQAPGGAPVASVSKETIFVELGLDYGVEYWCVMFASATNGLDSPASNMVGFIVADERAPAAPVLILD